MHLNAEGEFGSKTRRCSVKGMGWFRTTALGVTSTLAELDVNNNTVAAEEQRETNGASDCGDGRRTSSVVATASAQKTKCGGMRKRISAQCQNERNGGAAGESSGSVVNYYAGIGGRRRNGETGQKPTNIPKTVLSGGNRSGRGEVVSCGCDCVLSKYSKM